jgi:hypothetical protein
MSNQSDLAKSAAGFNGDPLRHNQAGRELSCWYRQRGAG